MTYDDARAIVAEQLPGMQVKCPGVAGRLRHPCQRGFITGITGMVEKHTLCHGRGYTPSDGAMLLLEEMDKAHMTLQALFLSSTGQWLCWWTVSVDMDGNAKTAEAFADTPQHAIFIAAANALQEGKE